MLLADEQLGIRADDLHVRHAIRMGRAFSDGRERVRLRSIVDRQQNGLTFMPGGIVSSAGPDQRA